MSCQLTVRRQHAVPALPASVAVTRTMWFSSHAVTSLTEILGGSRHHQRNLNLPMLRCAFPCLLSQEAGFRFQYPEVTAALRSVAR